ncbi:MAG: hypothetical protein ACOX42_10465 [Clostridia bacterium]|jgi:hypothetical protein
MIITILQYYQVPAGGQHVSAKKLSDHHLGTNIAQGVTSIVGRMAEDR